MLTCCCPTLQASQSGYAVDYVTQGAQGGFPGNFINQNSQAGYSRFGTGNDFMSQVWRCAAFHYLVKKTIRCPYHHLANSELRTAYFRTTWLMVHKVYLPRLATMTRHRKTDHRTTTEWGILMRFSLRFLYIHILFNR